MGGEETLVLLRRIVSFYFASYKTVEDLRISVINSKGI